MITLSSFRRRLLTMAALALLAMPMPLSAVRGQPASGESLQTCLAREADALIGALAVAIASSVMDPANVDDAFMARQSESSLAGCTASTGQAAGPEIAAFRARMSKWSVELDRRLEAIVKAGASD